MYFEISLKALKSPEMIPSSSLYKVCFKSLFWENTIDDVNKNNMETIDFRMWLVCLRKLKNPSLIKLMNYG